MSSFDRTAFRINTFEEADDYVKYWLSKSPTERLEAMDLLNRRAYHLADDAEIRLDRRLTRIKSYNVSNIFNRDIREFIQALNAAEVDYLLVGGYAVNLHGYSRSTGDVDIWVNPTESNYGKLVNAFEKFRMPTFDMTLQRFVDTENFDVFTFGVPPSAIDLMTMVKGLDFQPAFDRSTIYEFADLEVRTISYNDLILAKLASGRLRDLSDVEQLKKRED